LQISSRKKKSFFAELLVANLQIFILSFGIFLKCCCFSC